MASQDALLRIEHVVQGLAEEMLSACVPGVSVAVIDRGEIAWAQGFGVAENGDLRAVNAATLFQAASISKPTTTLVALRLVEAGKISLDEDVNTYLKSWKVPKSGDWQPLITLRQIINHRAGTTIDGFPGYKQGSAIPSLVQVLNGEEPANTSPVVVDVFPGALPRYSGGGVCIMQQALMDVSGMPFADLARQMVLEPLGMEHSTFEQPLPGRLHGTEAAGHDADGKPVEGRWHVYPEQAAAGLWTTPTDLCKMAMAIQRVRAGEYPQFLAKATLDDLVSRQNDLYNGFSSGILRGTGRHLIFEHTGENEGFMCCLRAYADLGFGACVMTNGHRGDKVFAALIRRIAAEYDWPGHRPEPQSSDSGIAPPHDSYAGVYELLPGYTIRADIAGDALLVSLPGQEPFGCAALSGTVYVSSALNMIMRFEVVAGDTILWIYQNGSDPNIFARRVE